jgi:hypothetical protein
MRRLIGMTGFTERRRLPWAAVLISATVAATGCTSHTRSPSADIHAVASLAPATDRTPTGAGPSLGGTTAVGSAPIPGSTTGTASGSAAPGQPTTSAIAPTNIRPPTTSAATPGWLTGTVLARPGCPGPDRGDGMCPPRPVADALIEITGNALPATSTTTDTAGVFKARLAPGTYTLKALNAGGPRSTVTQTVTVGTAGAVVTVYVDSGIR